MYVLYLKNNVAIYFDRTQENTLIEHTHMMHTYNIIYIVKPSNRTNIFDHVCICTHL